jgi:hypothetical protein
MIAQADALLAGSASSHWWNTERVVVVVMENMRDFSLNVTALSSSRSASHLEGCADFPGSGKSLRISCYQGQKAVFSSIRGNMDSPERVILRSG